MVDRRLATTGGRGGDHGRPPGGTGGGGPALARTAPPSRLRADGAASRAEAQDSRTGAPDPRAGVPEIQRARILAALVEVARERGVGRMTVGHVIERSGVSRRTFYELFADREECVAAAFEGAIARAAGRVVPTYEVERPWQERVRAGLLALLEFLDGEPGLGGLCVVDSLGAGQGVLTQRLRIVAKLADVVDAGRGLAPAGKRASRLTAEGVVGGVLGVIYARIVEARATPQPPLTELLNPLMAMIVLPYLGSASAARELARKPPAVRRQALDLPSNPLEGLAMRLTYRTVRVLTAIAATPGASNRAVGNAAGVADQGQISKLLGRLEHLGLIENVSGGVRGESNAWRLTPRGEDVERTIRRQVTPDVGGHS